MTIGTDIPQVVQPEPSLRTEGELALWCGVLEAAAIEYGIEYAIEAADRAIEALRERLE